MQRPARSVCLGVARFRLSRGKRRCGRPGSELFESRFLCVLGLLFLSGYVVLGKLYLFSVPFRGIVIATVCYIAGLVVAWA
jgi:hypothetical protein